jgi:hypothetical protein
MVRGDLAKAELPYAEIALDRRPIDIVTPAHSRTPSRDLPRPRAPGIARATPPSWGDAIEPPFVEPHAPLAESGEILPHE